LVKIAFGLNPDWRGFKPSRSKLKILRTQSLCLFVVVTWAVIWGRTLQYTELAFDAGTDCTTHTFEILWIGFFALCASVVIPGLP